MNIIDRISLHSLLKTILNFILAILKIFFPQKTDELDNVKPDRRIIRPRRKVKDE